MSRGGARVNLYFRFGWDYGITKADSQGRLIASSGLFKSLADDAAGTKNNPSGEKKPVARAATVSATPAKINTHNGRGAR